MDDTNAPVLVIMFIKASQSQDPGKGQSGEGLQRIAFYDLSFGQSRIDS